MQGLQLTRERDPCCGRSWGDGDEGKLGLGRPGSQARPTMIDFLMPSDFADAAGRSANKDALKRAGAKLIRSKGHGFAIGLISCGARHTAALSCEARGPHTTIRLAMCQRVAGGGGVRA